MGFTVLCSMVRLACVCLDHADVPVIALHTGVDGPVFVVYDGKQLLLKYVCIVTVGA